MRQQRNEGLRRKFGEKANVIGPWIERQMDAVTAVAMSTQGTLEDQLHKLRNFEQQTTQNKPQLEELEKIHQEVQESLIFENRYTQYTMEVSCSTKAAASNDDSDHRRCVSAGSSC